ncbi:hypothetical protein VS868_08120 [Salinimicrobium sp. 3283s]|uniref:hypothetical protein n=1 Tax=Salinimicrobium sp. 3283s TaxID=3114359 RepID=UPI0031E9F636
MDSFEKSSAGKLISFLDIIFTERVPGKAAQKCHFWKETSVEKEKKKRLSF